MLSIKERLLPFHCSEMSTRHWRVNFRVMEDQMLYTEDARTM